MSIDLAAEKLIAAERENEKIAVEVKSFLEKSSAISEFHTALGQFINYRGALRRREPERSSTNFYGSTSNNNCSVTIRYSNGCWSRICSI